GEKWNICPPEMKRSASIWLPLLSSGNLILILRYFTFFREMFRTVTVRYFSHASDRGKGFPGKIFWLATFNSTNSIGGCFTNAKAGQRKIETCASPASPC